MTLNRVENDTVWRYTKVIFLAAALLFLVNIAIGFDNALSTGPIAHWQILTHLHAGAIGWITLSVIGLAIWLFTGHREVSGVYVRGIQLLTWLAILTFVAYIASIAVAFSQGGEAMNLLPIGGTGAMLMIWAAAIFAVSQLRQQSVVTTIHLLIAAGLLVAALGATMGVLLGLRYATGVGIETIQAHAPPMLFYLFLVASGVVEWVVLRNTTGGWTRLGILQVAALMVGAIIPPIAFLLNLQVLAPVMLLMLFLFLILFLVRIGWRALYTNPFTTGVDAWIFFGTFWTIIVVVFFPAELLLQPDPPAWLLTVLAHAAFVGMMTNLLFGVLTARTRDVPVLHPWLEPIAMWLLNLGLLTFIGLKIALNSRLGALVMGIGVLLGLGGMMYRLVKSPIEKSPQEMADELITD